MLWGRKGIELESKEIGFRVSEVALVIKNSSVNARGMRDASSIPGSGRSPGGGHVNSLQYSSLENLMNREAWKATVQGVAKSWTGLK